MDLLQTFDLVLYSLLHSLLFNKSTTTQSEWSLGHSAAEAGTGSECSKYMRHSARKITQIVTNGF